MSFFDSKVSKFLVDDTGATQRDLSAYITEVRGLPGPRTLNEVTALGDSGVRFIPGLAWLTQFHFPLEELRNLLLRCHPERQQQPFRELPRQTVLTQGLPCSICYPSVAVGHTAAQGLQTYDVLVPIDASAFLILHRASPFRPSEGFFVSDILNHSAHHESEEIRVPSRLVPWLRYVGWFVPMLLKYWPQFVP